MIFEIWIDINLYIEILWILKNIKINWFMVNLENIWYWMKSSFEKLVIFIFCKYFW